MREQAFYPMNRHSFVVFAGLEYSGRVPDAKTIRVWRERLQTAGLMEAVKASVEWSYRHCVRKMRA